MENVRTRGECKIEYLHIGHCLERTSAITIGTSQHTYKTVVVRARSTHRHRREVLGRLGAVARVFHLQLGRDVDPKGKEMIGKDW